MTLEEAFSLEKREVISLVGGGGKTSLLFAFGKELPSSREGVLLTTTTKIWEPPASPHFALFLSERFSEMKRWIKEQWRTDPLSPDRPEKTGEWQAPGNSFTVGRGIAVRWKHFHDRNRSRWRSGPVSEGTERRRARGTSKYHPARTGDGD